jgi:hypothetical protein
VGIDPNVIRASRILRIAAKAALWLFVLVVSAVALWLAANRFLDEPPDPDRDAFLMSSQDQVLDERNIAIGILGLTAPAGVDFVQYGSKVKTLYTNNASWAEVEEMVRGTKTLRPTVNSDQVTCWLDPRHPAFAGFKACLPFDEAPRVLKQNRELIDRYKALYRLEHYSNLSTFYNQAFLVVLRLSMAEMHLDLQRRNPEAAYRKWRDQMTFVKTSLRGSDTWVGKAVGLVAFGMTFPFLENLLAADRNIAKKHATDLLELLQPGGIDAFNPDGIVRGEYALLKRALHFPPSEIAGWPRDRLHFLVFHLGQRNRILNRYHAFARDYVATLRLPWSQIEQEATRLRDKHVLSSGWDFVIDPFGSIFLAQYIEGQLRAREMLRQMHISDGKFRLATLLVRIINENVSDDDIPRLLSSAGRAFYDPFSGKPMRWHQKDRKLVLPDATDERFSYADLQVPRTTSR